MLQVLEQALIETDDDGRITGVDTGVDTGRDDTDHDEPAEHDLGPDTVLIPGLIDTHLHAPQWPQRGTGLDLDLERWLFDYTFPLEARYADTDFAVAVWDTMVPHLLGLGTTTVAYYGSIHEEATTALAEACLRHGQRAFVGRVAMDHPDGTPDWYRDPSASAAVAASHRSVDDIRALAAAAATPGLVMPIVTPRFIPACTDAVLEGLGELATATGTTVQTHCSESDWEHGDVLDRFGRTDAQALAGFGLVADHTVLAHATHLEPADRRTLAEHGAGVAHCPLSNSYFANAVFPVRRALDAGVRVGLGSDIAGGPEASMLAQCTHAVTSSRMLEDGVDVERDERGRDGSRIDITTAFWLATAGGAELLGIDAGLLEPGRVFDAVAVDIGSSSSLGVDRDIDDWPRIFEKLVRGAGAADIRTVWVDGVERTPTARG